jgi:putative ABC transport system permease protein
MFDTLIQDLRYAVRTLRSSPGFAAVAILSLALGIGANTAIFSLIDAVMLKYLPVSHPEQLLQIVSDNSGGYYTNPIWEQLRDRQDVFSGVFAWSPARFNLSPGGEAHYAEGMWASGDIFATLGVRPILGRAFTPADDRRGCPAIAVLTYSFWQKQYGGSAGVLNQTISLDSHPFQVVGVVEPGFAGMDVGRPLNLIVPLCTEPVTRGENSALDRRSSWWLRAVGRPKPGVSPQQVNARLQILAPEVFGATVPPDWRPDDQQQYRERFLKARPAATGLSFIRTEYRPALIALMVVVAVVLLIACANVANLLLARATRRQREIAVRLALGAGRARLIRQLLTESLLLSLAGAALGVLFAQWGSRLLVGLLATKGNQVSLNLALNTSVLLFTAAVAIATGLLFGMAPAWRSARVQPQSAMKANARGVAEGHSRFSLGKALVIAQVALSLVLLVGAGLLLGTFQKLATLNPGFEREHVLLVSVDVRNGRYPQERRAAAYREMLDRLRAIPGVRSASSSDITPLSHSSSNDELKVEGFTPKSREDSMAYFNQVSWDYFETLQTPLVAGRDFNDRDTPTAPRVAIINETMARKFFGNRNPLGKFYQTDDGAEVSPPVEIVGIVKDAKYLSLREEILPTVYVAASQEAKPALYINFELRAAGSATDLIPSIKTVMDQVNRDISLNFVTLETQVNESLNRERLLATLSGFFGGLALLLATIGLYGVMSYNVARRRNEIGIRMALGAERARVLRMVLREVALLVCAGVGVGVCVALACTRLVASFLFGLKATDPATVVLSAAVLIGVAALAGYLPARRASRLEPMAALREE